MKKRDHTIDLMKGICIILMVLGHTPFIHIFVCGSVYLYHMAVFFIASGFLYNDKYSDDIKSLGKLFIRKVKGLWLPYFLFTEAFILLNNLFLKLHIYISAVPDTFDHALSYSQSEYLNLKSILMSIPYTILMDNATHMGGALWFFQVLFYVLILYAVVDFLIKKIIKKRLQLLIVQGIIAIGLLSLGYYFSVNDLFRYSFGRIFSVYILIYIGVVFKELNILERLQQVNHKWLINTSVFVLNLLIIVFCSINIGSVALDKNSYVNPAYLIFVSITGWFMVQAFSNLLVYLELRINKLIEYISQRSVSIVALHFLSFKIVTYIGIRVYGLDIRYLAASSDLLNRGVWWIAYTVVGIAVPLLLDYLYLRIKTKIINKVQSLKAAKAI